VAVCQPADSSAAYIADARKVGVDFEHTRDLVVFGQFGEDGGVGVFDMLFEQVAYASALVIFFLILQALLKGLQLPLEPQIGTHLRPPVLTQFQRLMKCHFLGFDEIGDDQSRRLELHNHLPWKPLPHNGPAHRQFSALLKS
jgi:hypothetical protein